MRRLALRGRWAACIPGIPQRIANVFVALPGIPGVLNGRLKHLGIEFPPHALNDRALELRARSQVFPPGLIHLILAGAPLQLAGFFWRGSVLRARGDDLGDGKPIGACVGFLHRVPCAGFEPIPLSENIKAPNLSLRRTFGLRHGCSSRVQATPSYSTMSKNMTMIVLGTQK